MKINVDPKSKWPIQNALLVSDSSNLHMTLRDLIRPFSWRTDEAPLSAQSAMARMEGGHFSVIIIEETAGASAYESIRLIHRHPVGRLVPILVLLPEASHRDQIVYEKILMVHVAKKPLTPSDFHAAFKGLIDRWEKPIFATLRKCSYAWLNGQQDIAEQAIYKLIENPEVVPLAVGSAMRSFMRRQRLRDCETMIFETMKTYPRMPALILTMADFYMGACMPFEALRLFRKLKQISNQSPVFSMDLMGASLQLGQSDAAIEALNEWSKVQGQNEIINNMLARLYVSEGLEGELERVLHMNKTSVKRIVEAWDKAEQTQTSGTGLAS
jgi:CheY-like chemotaxis protein